MLWCMPWCSKRAKTQSAKVHLITIVQTLIACLELGSARRQEACPLGCQLAATRDEIRVEVRLGGEGHPHPRPPSGPEETGRGTAWDDPPKPAHPPPPDKRLGSQ